MCAGTSTVLVLRITQHTDAGGIERLVTACLGKLLMQ